MSREIPSTARDAFRCPNCREPLQDSGQGYVCNNCNSHYGYTDSGSLDLRLSQEKTVPHEFKLGAPLNSDIDFGLLPFCPAPEIDYSSFSAPHHLSKEILSHFPKAKSDTSMVLDIGCGDTVHRQVCEYAGYKYVGLDYCNDKAPILGDAHALPFADESFDFLLSIAVLEHIRYPFVMMKEAYRVLKPGGKFIGTVAFLEPFHGDSYYHHTHLGVYNSLQEGGFKVIYLCPNDKWSVLIAQANMALFPRMPKQISKAIVFPLHLGHKLWWKLGDLFSGQSLDEDRMVKTTGSFTFIAQK